MIDVRIGLAVDEQTNTELVAICQKLNVSKGAFVSAMVHHTTPDEREMVIAAYLDAAEERKKQKVAARKEFRKKVKSLTQAEIEAVLAARAAQASQSA